MTQAPIRLQSDQVAETHVRHLSTEAASQEIGRVHSPQRIGPGPRRERPGSARIRGAPPLRKPSRFLHPDLPELVNVQDVNGEAKPYQVRQVVRLAVRYSLGGVAVKTDYHINVFFSAEDGGWIADIPDLAICSAFGATAAEAVAEVERARDAWIATASEAGRRLPEPRYRPDASSV